MGPSRLNSRKALYTQERGQRRSRTPGKLGRDLEPRVRGEGHHAERGRQGAQGPREAQERREARGRPGASQRDGKIEG